MTDRRPIVRALLVSAIFALLAVGGCDAFVGVHDMAWVDSDDVPHVVSAQPATIVNLGAAARTARSVRHRLAAVVPRSLLPTLAAIIVVLGLVADRRPDQPVLVPVLSRGPPRPGGPTPVHRGRGSSERTTRRRPPRRGHPMA